MITRIVIECEHWNQEDVVAEISRVSQVLREAFSAVEQYSVDDIFPRNNEVVRDEIEGKQPGFYKGKRTLINNSRTSWNEERPEETVEPGTANHQRT
jgi:hypothetical protein